ncbi:MAG: ATP-binding cassette domain-containing protein [Bacteroidales bacterium]|nr:ATP-binding cassette domain-containing protein [Bacteroidales bacterium]
MDTKKTKLLELINITVGYNGNTVIKDANLEVYNDDFIGIIGPNGGGKTTLVKAIVGLLKPKKGEIQYHFNRENIEHSIGYMPQVNYIDKKFPISVRDVVMSGYMDKKKLFKRFTLIEKQKAEDLLAQTGIADLKKKSIGNLSGGELQRVFLCRSIISSPKLLILDEPNNFVDNRFESELYELLGELNKTMAVMIVSHDIGMLSTYIKTIACVNKELHYHKSNQISEAQLRDYNCPIQLITHGDIPHTVLKHHNH